MQVQAEKFARENGDYDFECSVSWITRWKKRHNILFSKINGEAGSINHFDIDDWIDKVWNKIKNDYKENNIFNIDESGLFYNLMPDKTLRLKGETCVCGKLSKEQLTVLIGANMSGTEKRKLLVIGRSIKPRCFKNVKNPTVKY